MPLGFIILQTVIINLALGALVFWTNRTRAANRQFLLLSLVIAAWLLSIGTALTTTNQMTAAFFIRQSHVLASLIPTAFIFIRIAVRHGNIPWSAYIRRSRRWLYCNALILLLCQTRFFLADVALPTGAPNSHPVPEPVFGPGFAVYGLLFMGMCIVLIYSLSRHAKHAVGIQRSELQFLTLGAATGFFAGSLFAVILPVAFGSSQLTRFSPFSAIVLDGIVAYGIATRRILEVPYLLQRATSYLILGIYLAALYAAVWSVGGFVLDSTPLRGFPVAHILATLAVAFSMAPAHGRMQRVANRLFVTGKTMDVGSAVGELNDMLQSIRTMPNLLERFSQTVAGSIGTEDVSLLLRNHSGFEQQYPQVNGTGPLRLEEAAPLVQELQVSREPVVADELQRLRPTPQIKAMSEQLTELATAVAVGIRSPERLEGILLLGPKLSGRIYGAVELNALPILCDQLAVAIENAELYTQTRDGKIYNEVLLDNLTSGVIAAGVDGQMTVVNREARRILGVEAGDLVGRRVEDLPLPLAEAMQTTLQTGHGLRDRDIVVQPVRGEETPVRMGSSVFTSHTGGMLGVLVVFTDLTTIKKLETQVRRTDRLASIGTLAAGMAHEIKNPLVTVKTFTQLLPERYQDEEFRGTFSELIGQEVTRIDSIVNQLLKFARPAKPNLVPTSLHEVIEHCLRLTEQQLKQKNIQMVKKLDAKQDLMMADSNLLQQAFVNFFLNATDSMSDGGTLEVATHGVDYDRRTQREYGEGAAQRIMLTIRDTGAGIPPEELGQIFDPFFTTKSQGTGLGLSVSHGIIQDHGGDIDISSVVGQGTTFYIVFPLEQTGVPA